jgi:predicted lipid-binding transport protein (Tim44 family)
MAEASLAFAERRAGDLKIAAEKLGQTPPTSRQLFMLRLMGVISPPPGASPWLRVRGILLLLGAVVAILALGFGIVKLIALPFGGLGTSLSIFWGFVLVIVALVVLVMLGRRRQKRARAQIAERRASQAGR